MNDTVTQTADAVSGSRTVSSRPGMNRTEAQLQRADLKVSQVDPPRNKEKKFVGEGAFGSAI